MTKKLLASAIVAVASFATANAGGILTNTNQSVAFLRMPAREASIGIDGVYSNPAGVAFLKDGWHLGATWQCAVQKRTVEETSPLLDHTLSGEAMTKRYRGHATAPFIPSVSAAYNWMDKWSFQFHFAVSGGGGKCQYENGLGEFEGQVGNIASQLSSLGAMGYGVDGYMEGRQYYFGVTLGAAYKVTPNLSVYGGLRGLIASASYAAQLKNIQVATSKGLMNLKDFVNNNPTLAAYQEQINSNATNLAATKTAATAALNNAQYQQAYAYYEANAATIEAGAAAGNQSAINIKAAHDGYVTAQNALAKDIPAAEQQLAEKQATLDGTRQAMENQLSPYYNGLDLSSDQSGFGISPIIGVDYKIGRFNLAAKYEFRTKMNLKNSSNLEAATMAATAQYVNGTKVREDSPALLAFGVQYSPVDIVRVNLGYHHFYDKDAKKTYFTSDAATSTIVRHDDKNSMLSHGTNEYLGGIEVDASDRLILSCGAQITRYGLTDEYMSEQSFVVNSWSLGFGASYQANPNVKIEAGYFKTFYDHYKTATAADGSFRDFTRTNDVIGVGLVVDL